MALGQGSKASLGLGTDVSYGADTAPAFYPVITSESIVAPRELLEESGLTGESEVTQVVPGVATISGGYEQNLDGLGVGQGLWLWNGNAGYTQGAMPGQVSAAPTSSGATNGGSLEVGAFRYKVATLLNWTGGGQAWVFICPASAGSAAISTSGSNLQIPLTWTNPVSFPQGFTLNGTAIYRTETDGAADSEKFLHYLAGSGNTYTDTGSINNGSTPASTVDPVTGVALRRHGFVGTTPGSGVEKLPSFAVSVNKDNDYSERYMGCRMNELKLSAGGPNEFIKAAFTLIGQKAKRIANFTPTTVSLAPMVGWASSIAINGGNADCNVKSFEFTGTNNCVPNEGMCGTPFINNVDSGIRKWSGTFTRGFVDHNIWDMMLAGTEFSLRLSAFGQPILKTGATLNLAAHGVDATPFPYFFQLDLPRLIAGSAGGPAAGPTQIIETVNVTALKDPTIGSAARMYLYNTQSTAYQ